MGLFAKIKEGLKKTRENVSTSIDKMLHSFQKIDEELFEELEELLVLGDVGVPTAERICEECRRQVKERKISDPNEIYGLIREITADMMRGGEELDLSTSPSVILVIGVNGVGKTTTIGKLAYRLKRSRRVGELVRAQQPYGVLLTTVPELLPVQPVGKPLEP